MGALKADTLPDASSSESSEGISKATAEDDSGVDMGHDPLPVAQSSLGWSSSSWKTKVQEPTAQLQAFTQRGS
ncbi:hypothetical protein V7S43_007620 [Phytophthora oleae]|uniref:Uncharacterized protein n=1 Tax=Phytophthora oleae TaxID=2107226 RepID=A0ABD3FM26_9STRA